MIRLTVRAPSGRELLRLSAPTAHWAQELRAEASDRLDLAGIDRLDTTWHWETRVSRQGGR